MRILVLDDEPLIALMVQEWLVELGHETVGPASTVQTALALIDEALDGAILDVSVGSQQSYPVADALTERNVPYVFATGHNAQVIDPRFASPIVLEKPFKFEGLCDAVDALAGRQKRSVNHICEKDSASDLISRD